ncbi:hypothetical protein [Micromonospora coerulea]|uniref:hypothetical protein n=1 Tax=Micromonospora coerulea TaxID=47856 RepID=UPI0031F8F536
MILLPSSVAAISDVDSVKQVFPKVRVLVDARVGYRNDYPLALADLMRFCCLKISQVPLIAPHPI